MNGKMKDLTPAVEALNRIMETELAGVVRYHITTSRRPWMVTTTCSSLSNGNRSCLKNMQER